MRTEYCHQYTYLPSFKIMLMVTDHSLYNQDTVVLHLTRRKTHASLSVDGSNWRHLNWAEKLEKSTNSVLSSELLISDRTLGGPCMLSHRMKD